MGVSQLIFSLGKEWSGADRSRLVGNRRWQRKRFKPATQSRSNYSWSCFSMPFVCDLVPSCLAKMERRQWSWRIACSLQ